MGSGPQVYVSTFHAAANTATGSFTVSEISADPNGNLEHLYASFVQFSNDSSHALRGWAWYKAESAITSSPFAFGKEGIPFDYQIVANNQPTSYDCPNLPSGLSLNPQSGRITGMPNVHGPFNVIVDAVGPSSIASETLWFKFDQSQSFANISTRARIGAGDNSLIGGFIIVGPENKQVIIRALGPSLSENGAADALDDPLLELHDGSGALITSNDDWRSHQAEVESTGLAPSDDRESAIVATLTPGNYTAVVTGKAGATGVGLVEVYDVSPSMSAHLANVSTRCFVDVGDNVLIGGLILAFGPATDLTRILVKGLGPSLASNGVQNSLRDPIMELHNSNGTLFATNDNWRGAQEDEIRATGVAPSNDLESAFIAMLGPGNYTAIVRGKDGAVGVALVEAYQLDN